MRNNQVLNKTKISTDPSWQGLPYDDSKFIGWHYGLAANDHRFRYGSWEGLCGMVKTKKNRMKASFPRQHKHMSGGGPGLGFG